MNHDRDRQISEAIVHLNRSKKLHLIPSRARAFRSPTRKKRDWMGNGAIKKHS